MNNITMDILPIDKEVLEQNEKEVQEEQTKEVKEEEPKVEQKDEDFEEDIQEKIFIKPKKEPKLNKNGKPRKPLSQKQIDALAAARQKSIDKRKKLKEANDMAKAEKKLKRELVLEEKMNRKSEEDMRIRLAAQMKLDAEKATHFSEARLTALMEKTIDNYMTKRKAMKPKPRESIPYPDPNTQTPYGQTQQVNPQPKNSYYTQPNHRTDRNPHYRLPPPKKDNPMHTLFGNFDD
jgi:hypothetical protein